METREIDVSEIETLLPLVGGVLALIAVALPWIQPAISPGAGSSAGYQSSYGLMVGLIAIVVLVVMVVDVVDSPDVIALVGGAVIALLGLARLLTIGDGLNPRIGVYLAVVAGLVVAVGGVLGR